jgi:hypothetical protein
MDSDAVLEFIDKVEQLAIALRQLVQEHNIKKETFKEKY